MGKKIFWLYLLIPVVSTIIASGFKSTAVTIGVLVLSLAVTAFLLRAEIMMLIATLTYSKNKEKSIELMKKAYRTGKLNPSAQLMYAYIVLRNGDLDSADTMINKITYLGKNILSKAELKKADFNRALICWKRGNLSDAIMMLEQLYSDGYLTSDMYNTLGYFYIANNETDKAIELTKEGIDFAPDNLVTADNLGQAYIMAGMLDEAQKLYETLIPKNPEFIEAYFNYATLLERRGMLTEARDNYEKALEYEEKFFSTVSREQVAAALTHVEELLK